MNSSHCNSTRVSPTRSTLLNLLAAGMLLVGFAAPAIADNYRPVDRYDLPNRNSAPGFNGRRDFDPRRDFSHRREYDLPRERDRFDSRGRYQSDDWGFEDSFSGGRSDHTRYRLPSQNVPDFSRDRRELPDYNGRFHTLPWNGDQYDQYDRDDLYGPPLRSQPYPNSFPGDRYPPSRPSTGVDQRQDLFQAIQRRYQDPAVLQMLSQLTPDRALAGYAEMLRLIESRHIDAPNLSMLVQMGTRNLVTAVSHPTFVQVTRMNAAPDQVLRFQQTLSQWSQQQQVRSVDEAVAVVSASMQAAGQMLNLSPTVVAVEYLYGATDGLDQFSGFVPPQAASATSAPANGVVGIGVQIEAVDRGVHVLRVFTGGPAASAGLQKGDVIVAVNGRSLAGAGVETATSLITGAEGTVVQLALSRGSQSPFQVTLPRRAVAANSVSEARMIDPASGVAYIKLETFAKSSTQELEAALWALHQQNMQGLIFDLRDNPGGLLTTAVEVSNLFLPQGTIVSTRGRTQADNTTETASSDKTWKVPLIVLINENSASASEIFAAAIQENRRGTVVGRHSYGKGTVQTLFPLQSISAMLRLTTAKFYSPTNREMANVGVEPDVRVSASTRNTAAGDLTADPDLQAGWQVLRGTNRNYPVSLR